MRFHCTINTSTGCNPYLNHSHILASYYQYINVPGFYTASDSPKVVLTSVSNLQIKDEVENSSYAIQNTHHTISINNNM